MHCKFLQKKPVKKPRKIPLAILNLGLECLQ